MTRMLNLQEKQSAFQTSVSSRPCVRRRPDQESKQQRLRGEKTVLKYPVLLTVVTVITSGPGVPITRANDLLYIRLQALSL